MVSNSYIVIVNSIQISNNFINNFLIKHSSLFSQVRFRSKDPVEKIDPCKPPRNEKLKILKYDQGSNVNNKCY